MAKGRPLALVFGLLAGGSITAQGGCGLQGEGPMEGGMECSRPLLWLSYHSVVTIGSGCG